MTTRLVIVAVLLVGAIGCLVEAHAGGPGSAPAVAATSTPLLSARRLPIAIGQIVADLRLAQGLAGTVANPEVCAVAAVDGSPVFASNPTTPLIPASNLKLLTAYAALTRLGPTTTLATVLKAAAAPTGGVVSGPLYLVGGGDPLLVTAGYRSSQTEWTESAEPATDLATLADAVKAAGITRVTGGVVGDDTRYDAARSIPSWKASYLTEGQIGAVGALIVNGGLDGRAPAANPASSAAAALTALLRARGVTVGGPPTTAPTPAGAVTLASVNSLPMSEIVGEMLRESDNLTAEMLTKELGVRFGGGGTWPAGIQVIDATARDAGVPMAGVSQVDGSGLDRSDRLTCTAIVDLLSLTTPAATAIAADLPTAGDCGTLVSRFTSSPAAGRVQAKTGSLTGVSALSGFVVPTAPAAHPTCPPGAPAPAPTDVVFSLIANGLSSDAVGTAVENTVADVLAGYPELPVLDPLGPR